MRRGFVYFVQAKDSPRSPIKIGWSSNPKARLAKLQTAHFRELEIVCLLPGVPTAAERVLHERFSAFRIRGEWFKAEEWLLCEIEWMNGVVVDGPEGRDWEEYQRELRALQEAA